ncbi:virB8 family protein [Brucella pseudogrignonensis]|uniref:virB8 family protein n=1 Tax=Brucella pseudogrignonensis TaxID=419475 RepID=UPI0038D096B7
MIEPDNLNEYFRNARRFDQDRLLSSERSRKLAWTVAALSALTAIIAVGAVAALSPLKTVEPFVIRVDNSTGIVDVVSALTSEAGTYDEEVTKYFAAKYVRAREGYQSVEAEENFHIVSLLSGPEEQERFAEFYRGSNPRSPQVLYRNGVAKVTIQSISLVNRDVTSVRYTRTVTRSNEEPRTTHWIATLTNAYVNVPIATSDRLVNPLGYVVIEYRSDPEEIR